METTNYIREYYKSEEHDLSSLLNADTNSEEVISKIRKEIAKMQKEIELKSVELHNELEKAYSKSFEPLPNKNIIRYDGRVAEKFYDLATGLEVDEVGADDIVYTIYNKSDTINVVVGYSYELASIITKEYKYNISRDNTKINTKLMAERVVSFLEPKVVGLHLEEENVVEENSWHSIEPLARIKDNVFINKLYGVDYQGKYNLKALREKNLSNKSFEIILKTSPKEIMDDLLKLNLEQALPIYKIIGVSQETYNKAVERGTIRVLFDNREYINGSKNEQYGINKTESEWFEIIDEMKNYEEDLKFYNIDYSNNYYYRTDNSGLLNTILSNYANEEVFKDNYSFGKFANYVINETINQGYNRIRDFISELRDYLKMCKQDNIKPTLYSSYLKQTHDITSRNHNVKVEQENEEIFQNRYKDFKPYRGKKYIVVAPKNSNDLKKEGDTLNHCVASYIKRVIDGECLIYFLRIDKDESLITFEVRHNDIVQVRGLHNRKPSINEVQALKDFAKYRKLGCNF